MKLVWLMIRNFRGLDNISFVIEDFTTFIGKNNCGKSSVLRAIELLCTGEAPDLEEFLMRNIEESIIIEAIFENIQEWERGVPGISGLIYNNRLQLRYIATIDPSDEKKKCKVTYQALKPEETISGWSESWPDVHANIKEVAAEIGFTTGAHFRIKKNQEQIKDRIRQNHSDWVQTGAASWSEDSISINSALQQAIPKVILIPAVKDASAESKASKTGKNAFGELMRRLILPQIHAEEQYQEIMSAVQALMDRMRSPEGITGVRAIDQQLSRKLSRLIDARASIRLDNPEIDAAINSGVSLRVYDGDHDTPVWLQGHGLQRALIFSLLEMVAETDSVINEEHSRSTIILFEEPELYLHPHMLRKLKAIFKTLVTADGWQVVCTTHSPVFVDVADHPKALIILQRDTHRRIIAKQLTKSPFENSEAGNIERDALRAALDFHPTVSEVFFAERTVLVEGDTEMAIFKHLDCLLESCGVDLHRAIDCTIVSCGGKWTIPGVARILNAFGIPFRIVHDMDRQGLSDEELAVKPPIHPFKANARIANLCPEQRRFVIDDTLEDLWEGSKSDKPYSAVVKITQLVQSDNIPDQLRELVRFVYTGFLIPTAAMAN